MNWLLKGIVWFFGWAYMISLYPIWNVFFNLYWLAVILFSGKWSKTRLRMKDIGEEITTIPRFKLCYQSFEYIFDGITKTGLFSKWPTWQALPIVIFYRGVKGNCEEAATMSHWLLKKFFQNCPDMKGKFSLHTKIMIPYNKFTSVFTKVHFVTVMQVKGETIYVLSSGKIYDESSVDHFASIYLKTDKFVWLV